MKTFLLLSILALVKSNLSAQSAGESTAVKIEAPDGVKTITLTVGSKTQTVEVNSEGSAMVFLPLLSVKQNVKLDWKSPGTTSQNWNSSIDFNGSGIVEVKLSELGVTSFSQWPVVEFHSSGPTLDVYINNSSKGSTSLRKGVEPERKHLLEWKKDGELKCSLEVSLPASVTRKYKCDPKTKTVTEM